MMSERSVTQSVRHCLRKTAGYGSSWLGLRRQRVFFARTSTIRVFICAQVASRRRDAVADPQRPRGRRRPRKPCLELLALPAQLILLARGLGVTRGPTVRRGGIEREGVPRREAEHRTHKGFGWWVFEAAPAARPRAAARVATATMLRVLLAPPTSRRRG